MHPLRDPKLLWRENRLLIDYAINAPDLISTFRLLIRYKDHITCHLPLAKGNYDTLAEGNG